MVLKRRQLKELIAQLDNLNINPHIIEAQVNYVLKIFEAKINLRYPHGLKLYLKSTKEIDKESDKLDISVSNAKDIIYCFLCLAKKYGWVRLAFMVKTGSGTKKILRQVKQIQLGNIHHKPHGYF